MTKEQRKIKELIVQVEELTKKLEEVKSSNDYYSKEYAKLQNELEEMHYTFDALSVPRKAPGQQYSELKLSTRMTLYVSGIRENVKNKEA